MLSIPDFPKDKIAVFSALPADNELIIIASKAKAADFMEALAPALAYYEQWAIWFAKSDLAAYSLLQQVLANAWLNAASHENTQGSFSLWMLQLLKEKWFQDSIDAQFLSSPLPLQPQGERVLFASIFQYRSQIALINALNFSKDTLDSRLELVLSELYYDVFKEAPSTVLRLELVPICLWLLKLAPPLEFKPSQELVNLVEGLLLYYLHSFGGSSSFSGDRYLLHLQSIKLPISYEKEKNIVLGGIVPVLPAEPIPFMKKVWVWQSLAVLFFVGMGVLGLLYFFELGRSNSLLKEKSLLESQTEILLSSVGKASALNKDMEQTLSLIQKEKARVFYLSGTEQAPETDVIVFTSTKSFKTYLFINTLLPNIDGKRYKIWYKTAGNPAYKLLALVPKNFGTNSLLSFGKSLKPTEFVITEQATTEKNVDLKSVVAR